LRCSARTGRGPCPGGTASSWSWTPKYETSRGEKHTRHAQVSKRAHNQIRQFFPTQAPSLAALPAKTWLKGSTATGTVQARIPVLEGYLQAILTQPGTVLRNSALWRDFLQIEASDDRDEERSAGIGVSWADALRQAQEAMVDLRGSLPKRLM
jgi:hypothetical protein